MAKDREELRIWAVQQASMLRPSGCSSPDLLDLAQAILDWVEAPLHDRPRAVAAPSHDTEVTEPLCSTITAEAVRDANEAVRDANLELQRRVQRLGIADGPARRTLASSAGIISARTRTVGITNPDAEPDPADAWAVLEDGWAVINAHASRAGAHRLYWRKRPLIVRHDSRGDNRTIMSWRLFDLGDAV